MKLYYAPYSPYSQKALIAVEEKGIALETHIVDLRDPAARAEFEKINRFGKVPFLLDEARDWRVPESSILIEYLERHTSSGTQLIPSDPEQSRQARYHDRIFDLYVTEPALKIMFDGFRPADKRDPMGVESAQKRLDKTLGLYDEIMAKRTWVLGESFSLGDIAAAAGLATTQRVRPFETLKNVTAYFGRLMERPSVQRVYKQVQEFMARR